MSTVDVIQKVTEEFEEVAKNPIVKAYLTDQIRWQVDLELRQGNAGALIGEWKHNCVGDLVTYIHAPQVASISIGKLIRKYGEPLVFRAFNKWALIQLEARRK